ncbi:MAG: RagB/SusD family nutrient uptake outer membrane protein [Mangrovibacterium sp.]
MNIQNRNNTMTACIKNKLSKLTLLAAVVVMTSACSRSFLDPDPLSFYDPETTFTTESGLQATMAMADRGLKGFWTHWSNPYNSVPIGTEYVFSDMARYSKLDMSNNICDFAATVVPTMSYKNGANDDFYFGTYWDEAYNGIKIANTVLTFIDGVDGLDEATVNKYKGQAYFHRAFRYLNLVFQYGNVPLVTKILEVPKQNYYSTKKEAIIEMITEDMEKAVEWVPDQSDIQYLGMVNKAACRQLLIKCYLASGRFAEAEEQANILIESSGYALMESPFGIEDKGGNSNTWDITRNVIWDLHTPENIIANSNTEALMVMPNAGEQSLMVYNTMRIFGPCWHSTYITTPDGKRGALNYAKNDANYDATYDYVRAFGRGIAVVGTSNYAQDGMWKVNGIEDNQDLRHNSEVGNWVHMEDFKYQDPTSAYYGQHFEKVAADGTSLVKDSLQTWFDFPLYKIYYHDYGAESNENANQFNGATEGSVAHMYLYRLAETYLLRAEARFYQGNIAGATEDVNKIRQRAGAAQMYTAVTIGDICAERGRELYLEEMRNVELTRISYCLALSGQPDEWGNTYSVDNWDKQQGTDKTGGSYWYQRLMHYSIYNQYPEGITQERGQKIYSMDKRNVVWPIPNSAITANTKGTLAQNYGYDGYDPSVKVWDNWEDAVADEDNVN